MPSRPHRGGGVGDEDVAAAGHLGELQAADFIPSLEAGAHVGLAPADRGAKEDDAA